ncbi:MAG: ATPase, T2SS/T4P/T4SS family [Planctomycetota bacterium]
MADPSPEPVDLDAIEQRLKILERDVPQRPQSYDPVRANLERIAYARFVAYVAPRGLPEGPGARRQLEADARAFVERLSAEVHPRPTPQDVEAVAQAIVNDMIAHGPLQEFLDDPEVSEIMVNGPTTIVVERKGRMERTAACFRDEQHLLALIRRIAERLNRRADFQSPILDANLSDGSRVHALLEPVALDGPIMTIRKFGRIYGQMEDLISVGTLRPEMAFYLAAVVKARLNVAIGGPSASGKTTLLNVLASQVPKSERLVTIEELAELDLSQAHSHVVRLQSRQETVEHTGEITIRQLVREALRMRADRIVVGEARGGEMIDVLQAMRCGHDGSMTTIHASSTEDLVERAVTISLFGNIGLGEASLRRMVVDALDVVVIMARFADGQRKVVSIVEPYFDPTGVIELNEVYRFRHEGYEGGKAVGEFECCGRTRFRERMGRMGIELPEEAKGPLR